jgi:hypothetical protein
MAVYCETIVADINPVSARADWAMGEESLLRK